MMQILLFLRIVVWEVSKVTVQQWHFPKLFYAMEVLGICLPCVKRYFELVQGNFFSLGLKLLRFASFWACWFGSNQTSQFNNNTFSKIFCYGSFRYVLPYIKRYFHWHQWIFFFFWAQITDSLVFGSCSLGKIKGHSSTTTFFESFHVCVCLM